jgi:hypothetical protein
LGVQAGLISVANEIVGLMMVGGAGSMSARGLRRSARFVARDDFEGSVSIVFRLAGIHTLVTESSSPSSRMERWSWRRAGLRRGECGEGERGEWRRRWGECARCGSV